MTEPETARAEAVPAEAAPTAAVPADHATAGTVPAARPNPFLQLAIGLLVFLAASFAALLAAGELGDAGVFVAVLIEVAAIAGIYRWCEA